MSLPYDVIVVGVGAMGASACFQMARRGMRVLGLEQFGIPHALGSSHGYSRAIRTAYYEHPDYVPLLQRAYENWRELETLSGQKLLHLTGGLYLGARDSELLTGSLSSARRHALPHEELDSAEISVRYPQFRLPEGYAGFYEPQAGLLRPELSVSVMAELAMRNGAEIHGHEKVMAWEAGQDSVAVQTARGSYRAKLLIFCGGAWSSELAADLGVELVVTRQVLGWTWPALPDLFEMGRFPTWALSCHDGSVYYGFPMLPDNPGVKIGHHARGSAADPETVVRHPVAGDEEDFLPALAQYLPDAQGPVLAIRICLYVNSPDSHFIIDRHLEHANVLLACGFSGHGFKFAAVIGEALADLAEHGRTELPMNLFRLSRFR